MSDDVGSDPSGPSGSIVLFDGVCNLCDASVNFIIDHDPRGRFAFAPLQSDVGQDLLARHGLAGQALDSVVLLEDGRCFTRSTAALRIARRLSGIWPLLYPLVLVPRPLRNAVYNWVARNRYRWFGKREQCRMPTPERESRFITPHDSPTSFTPRPPSGSSTQPAAPGPA